MSVKLRGWLAFALGLGAVLWAVGLVVGAFTLPAYRGEACHLAPGGPAFCRETSQTRFAVGGWWSVKLLLAVLLVAAVGLWALHVRCSRRSASAAVLATACIVVLAAFSVVTGLSIGPFVLPIVIFLMASAVATPPPQVTRAP